MAASGVLGLETGTNSGKFDPYVLKFPYDLIPAMNQQPFSDLRKWEEIRTWAEGLVERLGSKS